MFFYGPLYTDVQVLGKQRELIYNNSVRTQNMVWRTSLKQRRMETNRERESKRLHYNDDDDYIYRHLSVHVCVGVHFDLKQFIIKYDTYLDMNK